MSATRFHFHVVIMAGRRVWWALKKLLTVCKKSMRCPRLNLKIKTRRMFPPGGFAFSRFPKIHQ
jgi:hypothetical protein